MDLLKKGYTLRGTLRNKIHADALVNGAYSSWRDRVQIVVVSNIIAAGAFDEAVKGNPSPASCLLHQHFMLPMVDCFWLYSAGI